MSLKARCYRGIAGLRQLRSEWFELASNAQLFARYEWYFSAVSHLLQTGDSILFFRISDKEDRPLSIIPAVRKTVDIRPFGRIPALTLDWSNHLATFDFPLAREADPRAVGEAMLKAFKEQDKEWRVISWPRVMADSNAACIASALGNRRADIRPATECNTFCTVSNPALAPGFEVYQVKSRKLRHNLSNHMRRLSEHGPIQMRMAREHGEVSRFFEEFLRLESSGWKGTEGTGTAIALVPSAEAFYRSLLMSSGEGFETDIALLFCGEKAVAGQFLIRVARWEHVYKIGYDEEYAACSPGQILNHLVIEHAKASESIDRVSLVTGLDWNKRWDPISEPTLNVSLFRGEWRVPVITIGRRTLAGIKKVRSRLTDRETKARPKPKPDLAER